MELCKTQVSHKKNLDETETAKMIKETAVSAIDRMTNINNWAQASRISTDPILNEYNIEINMKMMDLNGRVLEPPSIQYGQKMVASRDIGTKGSWNHRSTSFKEPKSLTRWFILNLSRNTRDQVETFHNMMIDVGKKHGMNISPRIDYRVCKPFERDVAKAFEETMTKYKSLELFFVVMPGTNISYKVIKTFGELRFGVMTQCVDGKNVFKLSDQTVSNILLKMNSKLGGKNFILADISRYTIMIFIFLLF